MIGYVALGHAANRSSCTYADGNMHDTMGYFLAEIISSAMLHDFFLVHSIRQNIVAFRLDRCVSLLWICLRPDCGV